MAADLLITDVPLDAVIGWLAPCSACSLAASSAMLHRDLAPSIEQMSRDEWDTLVCDELVRANYREILGTPLPRELVRRRGWLSSVVRTTELSQWQTVSDVLRLMHQVDLDATDLFAALRRTFLASQVAALAENAGVVHWMHILGAVEEQDPLQSKLLAREAWAAMGVTQESLLWAVQTAHFVDDVIGLGSWFSESGLEPQKLQAWLQALQVELSARPALGRYGPAGDSQQVRPRHLTRLISSLD